MTADNTLHVILESINVQKKTTVHTSPSVAATLSVYIPENDPMLDVSFSTVLLMICVSVTSSVANKTQNT